MKKIEIDKDELYQYYVVEDHSAQEAMARFGVGKTTLFARLAEYGIKKGPKPKKVKAEKPKKVKAEKPKVDKVEKPKADKESPAKELNSTGFCPIDVFVYYILENHTCKETASKFGFSNGGFFNYLEKIGLKGVKKELQDNEKEIEKEELYQYYIVENHNQEETAKYFGICQSNLRNQINKHSFNKAEIKYDNVENFLEERGIESTTRETLGNFMGVDKTTAGKFVNTAKDGKLKKYMSLFPTVSKPENEIADFIRENYDGEVIQGDRTIIAPKEIDILIPDLKVGIEFNGLYWHRTYKDPSTRAHKDKYYHRDKTAEALEKGYHLITVTEDEWVNQNEIVKSKLLRTLKIDQKLEKIYARKCKIKEIDSKTKGKFLDANHIQGADRAKYKFGLFYGDRLVSVMTITNSIRVKGQADIRPMELSRFASDIKCNVVGSFSKLLKYAQKKLGFNVLETFADFRYSCMDPARTVYGKNGFEYLYATEPNYYYVSNNELKKSHRFNFRKGNLEKKFPQVWERSLELGKNTEWDVCEMAGYYRYYDCGNAKFTQSWE